MKAHNAEGYSYPVVAAPGYLSPKVASSAPFNGTFFALSTTQLKLVWQTPLNLGGAPIQRYRVEWDLSPDFKNVDSTGSRAEFDAPQNCYDINLPAASSHLPRYARIFAFNGFAWSPAGYPNPRSAFGSINPPGAPTAIAAAPTEVTAVLL